MSSASARQLPEGVEILYEPDLLPQTRYIADHKGRDGFARTPAQDRRWRDALAQATILWDFPSGPEGTRGLSLTPQVKWVQTTSSGVGQAVANMGLADSDVIVTTARGVHADALAEFALFIMLAHVKDLPRLQRDQQAHRWERYCCGELSGKSLTIIGAGQVGARVACLARAFNMRVNAVVNRPSPERRTELFADEVYGQADLKIAVKDADYIVLATPHTPQTERMIDGEIWAATKRGVVFVNIARGQVVDEPAMIEALGSGHIGLAGTRCRRNGAVAAGFAALVHAECDHQPAFGQHGAERERQDHGHLHPEPESLRPRRDRPDDQRARQGAHVLRKKPGAVDDFRGSSTAPTLNTAERRKNERSPNMKSCAKMAAAATLAASLILPMCVRAEDAKPQMGGELVLTGQLDKTMFPGRNTDAGGMDVYLNACENLVEMTADRTIKPMLAKSWTMSDDLKTITFQSQRGHPVPRRHTLQRRSRGLRVQ